MMAEWVKVGTRYINLQSVAEVRVNDRLRIARVFYSGGASADLDEDDTDVLLTILDERTLVPQEPHRTIIAPAGA